MIRVAAAVAEEARVPFHIHVAEYRAEREQVEARHGLTPVRYLDRLGVLGPQLVGVHCVWLDGAEVELLAARAREWPTAPPRT